MKKYFKVMMMAVMALGFATVSTSCSSDDDDMAPANNTEIVGNWGVVLKTAETGDVEWAGEMNFMANGTTCIVRDETGWWMSQNRYEEVYGTPAFIHYNTETGEVDFNSAVGGEDGTALVGNSSRGGFAINPAGTLMAVGSDTNIKVFTIANTRGTTTLTPLYTFAHGMSNTRVWNVAFDVADNVYVTNDNGAGMACFALPKTENMFTTEAPAEQAITIAPLTGVTNIEAKTVSSVEYINLSGVRSNTPWQGVNVIVTNYTDGTHSVAKVVK